MPEGEPLRVLQSFPEPRPTTNPYLVQLRRALDELPGLEQRTFSWRRALLGRYDVFHVHWPELLVAGHNRAKTFARRVLFLALVARLRATATPVVRTMHNLRPHEDAGPLVRRLLDLLDRRTTLVVRLNEHTPVPPGVASATIVHGHYRDWFARHPRADRQPRRAAFVGLIRPYKNVDVLLRAFADVPRSLEATLHIAGQPESAELAEALRAAGDALPGVALDLHFLTDEELVDVVARAVLVVLPYQEMHNSGAALMALSLDRPVLVPDNPITATLASEVGTEWVLRYGGELTAEALVSALESSHRLPPAARPDLSRREWHRAGHDHLTAYRRAAGLTGDQPGS